MFDDDDKDKKLETLINESASKSDYYTLVAKKNNNPENSVYPSTFAPAGIGQLLLDSHFYLKPSVTKNKKPRAVKRRERQSVTHNNEHPIPTINGGYLHTTSTRKKISEANKGNTPWNKGTPRSEAVRAKISEGVRARNRAVLSEKLDALGITEVEWYKRKKENKVYKERLRRQTLAAEKRLGLSKNWNKDKHHSDADRAKISEGVKAGHRAVLMEKLNVMGITEEEWNKKKKELRLHRQHKQKLVQESMI